MRGSKNGTVLNTKLVKCAEIHTDFHNNVSVMLCLFCRRLYNNITELLEHIQLRHNPLVYAANAKASTLSSRSIKKCIKNATKSPASGDTTLTTSGSIPAITEKPPNLDIKNTKMDSNSALNDIENSEKNVQTNINDCDVLEPEKNVIAFKRIKLCEILEANNAESTLCTVESTLCTEDSALPTVESALPTVESTLPTVDSTDDVNITPIIEVLPKESLKKVCRIDKPVVGLNIFDGQKNDKTTVITYVTCKYCAQNVRENEYDDHLTIVHNTIYTCLICTYSTAYEYCFHRHLLTHTFS